MSQDRKSSAVRDRDLRLAILRIERGRSRTGESKLTVASVAREAGVSRSLIYNHYPSIAELIQDKTGTSSGHKLEAKSTQLQERLAEIKDLRKQLGELESRISMIASVNEMLRLENETLKAQATNRNVRVLTTRPDR